MIAFMKSLWRDRRGNAILVAAAAMPMVIGAAGLATDTIQWTLWKRELQRAADSAAFAGVYAKADSQSVSSAVATDIARNNKTGIAIKTGFPVITFPTSTNYTNAVRVQLAVQKRLAFSSLFLTTAPTITAAGTAAMIDQFDYCLRALRRSGGPGITIGGSSHVALGCGAMSDSRNNPSVSTSGSQYSFSAPVVAGAGSLPSSINGVAALRPNRTPMGDPYAGLYSTAIPAGMACTNFNTHRTNLGTGSNPNYHLSPGCYTGFAPNGNNTYHLDPGVYYLNNTDFTLNGNDTLVGTGVTIILTGTTPGSVQTNGNSTVNLSAPTATNCGTYVTVNTCNYKGMLFIQSANATTGNNNNINGTNLSNYDGALYFPKGGITFTGNSGSITKCVMVVGYTVAFSGNTDLQNNTTGCVANSTVKGKEVRLVA
jgi:Flp pilus assembly protein TadG